MSADADHAAKVRRGMQLSREHKGGEHLEPNPDCSKCKAEAKQAGKVAKSAVPSAEAEVTLQGVTITGDTNPPEVTFTDMKAAADDAAAPVEKTPEQKAAEHEAAIKAAQEADREARQVIAPVANKPGEVGGDKTDYDILVHILSDGFTVIGNVWFRGQEIGIKRGSSVDELSTDRNGDHWYDMEPIEQMRRYGEQKFGLGPWPYDKPTINNEQEYLAALASGDAEAVRQFEKHRQRTAIPVAPSSRT